MNQDYFWLCVGFQSQSKLILKAFSLNDDMSAAAGISATPASAGENGKGEQQQIKAEKVCV